MITKGKVICDLCGGEINYPPKSDNGVYRLFNHYEYARLIVNKFLEKYTLDEVKEMSKVDLEAAFIMIMIELAIDED